MSYAVYAIRAGGVWKGKVSEEKICVVSVNPKTKQVWVSGFIDEVDPVMTMEYLVKHYEPVEYWDGQWTEAFHNPDRS